MIKIQVNGKDLVLYKSTSIEVELNSAMFATDAIEGDVAYSFDIPIAGNEITLEFGHDPHTKTWKHWPCTLLYNGIQFISGSLYLQKITKNKLTVGIVLNPYPDGFSDQSIQDNASETIEISRTQETHQAAWLSFLKRSLEGDSVKFAPFYNELGYGDNNEDFGFWKGYSVKKIVNRLFFNSSNEIFTDNTHPLFRIFCKENSIGDSVSEYNQFCFCPQFQLLYVLKNIVTAAGYRLIGDIVDNDDFKNLYIQSGKALDGTVTQFSDNTPEYYLHSSTNGPDVASLVWVWGLNLSVDSDVQNMLITTPNVKFYSSGFYEVNFSCETYIYYDCEVFFRISIGTYEGSKCLDISLGNFTYDDNNDEYATWSFSKTIYIPASHTNTGLFVGLVAVTDSSEYSAMKNRNSTISIRSKSLENSGWLNVFANSFTVSKYFPDVTNADFIKAVMSSLGISFFVDNNTKRIEMSFCKNVLNAQSMDLTNYLVVNKTEIEVPKEKQYCFKFIPTGDDTDIDEDLMLDDVNSVDELPDPYLNIGKICFVKDHNAFYIADKIEDADYNYQLEWQLYGGNNRLLTIGAGTDSEITESEVKIPSIDKLSRDLTSRKVKLIPSIPFEITSYLNNNSDGLEDIIMLYYRGKDHYKHRNFNSEIYYESMLPVQSGKMSLTVTGKKSWGENYIKRWFELYSNHRSITYTFLLPIPKLLEVIRLIRPQLTDTEKQIRAIIVNNVKSFPVKISFQLDSSGDKIMTEIETASI